MADDSVRALGYTRLSVRDIDAWREFVTTMLGMEVVEHSSSDTRLYVRMDQHHHRIIIEQADLDDVDSVGWAVNDEAELERVTERLKVFDIDIKRGDDLECAVRHVRDFVWFIDPNSNVRWEIFYGLETIFQPGFRPGRPISGFKTGASGFGHFVTRVHSVDEAVAFYASVLGFELSDVTVGPKNRRVAGFMHCNQRHHSLAFFREVAGKPHHLHHFMLEYLSIDDVGRAYDLAQERGLAATGLGRHNNDRMFSFYLTNPSGWWFEIGWGGREIDRAPWVPETYSLLVPGGGGWGHQGLVDTM
jgi:extradiol dioxygenase